MNARYPIVVLIAGWLWLGAALADTVRLKTGETFEGTILSESDAKVSVEVEYAAGTILSTETFNKDEIVEIVRSTPEQLAQRAMEHAYANTQKYKLDSAHNYTLNYYQLVINRVLRHFLADYPDSPYTNAVQAKLKEWIAEQDMVTSGLHKYHGVWIRAEEAVRRNAEAQARSAMGRGRAVETFTADTPVQRDIVDQVGEFLRRYWVIAIVAVVAMLWLCVHIFARD